MVIFSVLIFPILLESLEKRNAPKIPTNCTNKIVAIRFKVSKPKIFSQKEIIGLTLALDTISKGEEMLNKLTQKDQEILIAFVLQIEKDCLEKIFSK